MSARWPPWFGRAFGGESGLGSLEVGKCVDVVLSKSDASPVRFPLVNPCGHLTFQTKHADVHTVFVYGEVVKYENHLVGIDRYSVKHRVDCKTVDLRATLTKKPVQKVRILRFLRYGWSRRRITLLTSADGHHR